MKNLICFGTRPEWLKIKPLIDSSINYSLLYTGQHDDLLKEILLDYKIKYKIKIQKSEDRINSIISSILLNFPDISNFEYVVVQGDTASAFACALAAFNRGVKVAHIESGLRSFDIQHPFPEEGFRQMISRISSLNFCPTNLSKRNLLKEKVLGISHVVGNTVLDNLKNFKTDETTDDVIITLHRRENHKLINLWIKQINRLAISNRNLNFIFISHPNPNVKLALKSLKNVIIKDPMSHKDILNLISKCKIIVTDSGGLQEEGSFFNKKIIVCRETTERPEGIVTGHLHMCKKPEDLFELFNNLIKNKVIFKECPYGDGKSSEKIIKILRENDISI